MAKIGTERGFESGVGAEKGRRRCRDSRISVGKGKRKMAARPRGEMASNNLGNQEKIAIFALRDLQAAVESAEYYDHRALFPERVIMLFSIKAGDVVL